MIYGYARVSTKTQVKGNSLEEQKLELKQHGCTNIIEEQYTGKTTERPKFKKLVEEMLQSGDTLVVCKLDRFARTVQEGIKTIQYLFAKGVKVHVLNVGLLEDTPMGRFFVTTLLAVAELERNMILERTQAGKEIARTRNGYREGRPPVSQEKLLLAMHLIDDEGYSYRRTADATGIALSTIVRYRRSHCSGEI
ncbi:MAG: recombinase family protein [Acidaminococcaceae bacterium]|nr:recombinase family protein [Acidaminococcaceae bacterium]